MFVTALEHFFDLPVARVEIAVNARKCVGNFVMAERKDIANKPQRTARLRPTRLPGEVKGSDDDATRIGPQAKRMDIDDRN